MSVRDRETIRLDEDARREKNWKRWGPYLAERQWGTVREDYSEQGESWGSFPHDHARSRTYRWGEDGLLGITDSSGSRSKTAARRPRNSISCPHSGSGTTGPGAGAAKATDRNRA